MFGNKKIIVIMPAYNAEKTLRKAIESIPKGIVDEIILTDGCSDDKTIVLPKSSGIKTFVHKGNLGYGANQKTCYDQTLKSDAVV